MSEQEDKMEQEFTPKVNITGTMKVTIRGPDGKIKHVEELEVKPP